MPSRPWYKFFPGDYQVDTRGLPREANLFYRQLIDALWLYGPIEDSDASRARVTGENTRFSRSNWPRIAHYFEVIDGRIDHPKMRAQREELADFSNKRRAAGKKGGQASATSKRQASATNARDARARPDPVIQDQTPKTQTSTSESAIEGGGELNADQRAEAERLQTELRERRKAAGLVAVPRLSRVAALAASCVPTDGEESG